MGVPIITLTTDFGTRDPWVGIMKGVILGICPDARLVDLTHEIAPQDVFEAALALESAARHFPKGAAHLAVVDPGVGSSRRALALHAGGQFFVGPDNGLFTFALERAGTDFTAVRLEAPEYRLVSVSRTFHGRDLFAPAVAHIAAGVALARLGPRIDDPVRLPLPRARRNGDTVEGEVIAADHFGNLLTSVTEEDVAALGSPLALELAGRPVGGLASSYAECAPGKPAWIIGSTGRVEIFVRDASASAALGTGRGSEVKLRRI